MRKGIVGFLEALDLRDVTIVGESIGAVLALTAAADVHDRIRAVYALNTYDYETRYGDGIRRGNWFANLIIGSLQIPVFGAIGAALANRWILGKIMGGGYADPRKLPADLLDDFDLLALAEDRVAAIQVARRAFDDEELAAVRAAAVRALARVGHREHAGAHRQVGDDLVVEVIAGTTAAGRGRIAALDHRAGA